MYFVRQMKPLGTSLLISILRGVLATQKLRNISNDELLLDKIFDESLKSHLIPQFEDLKTKQLELLRYFFSVKKLSTYRSTFGTDEQRDQYKEELGNIVKFTAKLNGLEPRKVNKKIKNIPLERKKDENDGEFSKRQKDEDFAIRETFDNYWKGTNPKLPSVHAKITEMLTERGNLDSEEYDEIENIE